MGHISPNEGFLLHSHILNLVKSFPESFVHFQGTMSGDPICHSFYSRFAPVRLRSLRTTHSLYYFLITLNRTGRYNAQTKRALAQSKKMDAVKCPYWIASPPPGYELPEADLVHKQTSVIV